MSAPLTLEVSVDNDEYSRFEEERNTVYVTVTPTGQSLSGEKVSLELRKGRRARDEIVAVKTLTITDDIAKSYQLSFVLTDIVDEEDIPTVRRGKYFIHAVSVTEPSVEAVTEDFHVSLISVARLKADYLHGTDQFATNVLTVLEQPRLVTGVTIDEVSLKHPQTWASLSYNFATANLPSVTGVTTGPFALVDGYTLVVRLDGDAVTVTFDAADFVDITAATETEVAAAVTDADVGLTGSVDTGSLVLTGGNTSILIDPTGTATTVLGLLGQQDAPAITRTLSWCGGTSVVIEPGVRLYTLRRGNSGDYVRARVRSVALLPTESRAEELLVSRTPLTDARIRAIVDEAISWVEDVSLSVYVEPTRVVTEVPSDAISYDDAETTIPQLVGATWDEVVDPLTYTAASSGHWINFKSPYLPLIRFDELYGKLSSVRIIDISLEWIEHHETSGMVELVPFSQASAFNFIGLIWVESLRGPMPLPNFWNFDALVGFRKTPEVLLELIAKKAAVTILVIAGQAFRPGFSSQSVSRDGVSESVSYTQSAQAGIFGATIKEYNDWIKDNLVLMKGAFRGPNMLVV